MTTPRISENEIAAYVTGPSGGGKTTYVEKHFPSSKYKVISTDDYEQHGHRGGYSVDWKKIKDLIYRSKKPVVLEGMVLDKGLARVAGRRILIDPGKPKVFKQRTGRGERGKHKDDTDPAEAGRLWKIYQEKILPGARELGFERQKAAEAGMDIRGTGAELLKLSDEKFDFGGDTITGGGGGGIGSGTPCLHWSSADTSWRPHQAKKTSQEAGRVR